MNLAIVQPVAGASAKRFPYREDVAAFFGREMPGKVYKTGAIGSAGATA